MKNYLTEDKEAEILANYLRARNIKFTHIANERRTTPQRGAKLKRMGVNPGVPDFMIILEIDEGYNLIFIELKRAKKSLSRVSEYQKEWIEKLNECREVGAYIAYGADEAIKIIESFIN